MIPLPSGDVAFVDANDREKVTGYRWCKSGGGYVDAHVPGSGSGKKRRRVYLHRLILDAQTGVYVDHKDGDPLWNVRENLRLCTNQQNMANNKGQFRRTSRFKGVYWFKRDKKWRAEIKVNYKRIRLGYFKSEEDAARAYNEAARTHYGDFARLNKVS